ncbi:MAG TPA: hypothetical protein VGF89_00880 [Steroidobacteraceae bacterium]|jgi:hypothetical protein
MNALEIKLAAIAIVSALLAGAAFYEGWAHGTASVQAKWNVEKLGEQKAVEDAQARALAAEQQQEAAVQAVQQDYETKLRTADATSTALSGLVRQYEDRLRRSAVPARAVTAGGPAAGAEVARGDGGVDAAAAAAIEACQSDAAQLGTLIEWVQKTTVQE